MVRPRNGSPCSEPYLTAPSLELIPNSVTIERAILVACSMSDTAPVVGSRNTSSSAARPPIANTSCAIISERVRRPLSSSGTATACPPVRPRARIVTL
ncbi:Uncharacterised protein [Mycobacterium tuberculosis]|nr:Uncharacterised protein [Mycobacterium tuberculosis]COW49842.1 Uncharacterised protein [Mycobacterium tuberculosis]COW73484.1 Uncharacterised protein [Mycobacterium tuberculosis]COY27776.1 Uncharacterised protein [Mycobacterium tuberculosis]